MKENEDGKFQIISYYWIVSPIYLERTCVQYFSIEENPPALMKSLRLGKNCQVT